MNKLKLISMYRNYGTENAYDDNSKVYAITDNYVFDSNYRDIPRDKKIALMIEPRTFIPEAYRYLEENYNDFKYIFTFDDELLKLPNAKPIIYGTCWSHSDSKKTKGVSMICSEKTYLEGHRKRQEIATILHKEGLADVMGKWNGGEYVDNIEAYRDYKFNVAMENDKQGYYITEKLCTCLANKVVPIYYGGSKVSELFNMDGIIYVENRDDIPNIIRNLDIDAEYNKRLDAINENYELVKQYDSFDDYFYNKYKKEIEEMFK